jgi:hypothetical protein
MHSFKIGCRTMRDAVMVSGVFLLTGLALLAAGKLLVPELLHMDLVVRGLGVVLLLFVPFILITTYLRTASGGAGLEDDTQAAGIGEHRPSPPGR